METKKYNIVVPKHKANAVEELLCDITGTWPLSNVTDNETVFIWTEMADEEVAQADHRLEMIL